MVRPSARPLYSSNSPQVVPLSIPGARPPAWPLRLPPLELVGTRPPQKRWLRRPNLLRLKRLRRMTTPTCTFACRGKIWCQWITGSPRRSSNKFPIERGHRMQHQFFTPFRCSCRHPRRSSGVVIPAPFHTRVYRSYSLADVGIRAWRRWRRNRIWRR